MVELRSKLIARGYINDIGEKDSTHYAAHSHPYNSVCGFLQKTSACASAATAGSARTTAAGAGNRTARTANDN